MGFGLLSLLTWLPIAGGLVVLFLGDRGIKVGRWVALATAVVVFGASIPLWTQFVPDTPYCRENMRYFGLETVPIVADGIMYVTRPPSACPGFRRCTPITTSASTASPCR